MDNAVSCELCGGTDKLNDLIRCSGCGAWEHGFCVGVKISTVLKIKNKWECLKCLGAKERIEEEDEDSVEEEDEDTDEEEGEEEEDDLRFGEE